MNAMTRPLLDPKNPSGSARESMARKYVAVEDAGIVQALYRKDRDLYLWREGRLERLCRHRVRADVWFFLESADRIDRSGNRVQFTPTTAKVNAVEDALQCLAIEAHEVT